MDQSSRNRLTDRQLDRFPGDTLFERIARAVCHAGCLPRKELYEAWEVARRVRRRFRGGRVVDLACGHGLLASILLLLDDSSPRALGIDRALPESAAKLQTVLEASWPRLRGRVELQCGEIDAVELTADDLVVSVHACGGLTDRVIDLAIAARARLAVLPCCHDLERGDCGGLRGWLDGPLAMDVTRATRLRPAGYRIVTQTIPEEITPKNRLLLAEPLLITQNGEAKVVRQDIESYEQTQETQAFLKILALGSRQIEEGKVLPATDAVQRLREKRRPR